jgi:hypothetical protein
MDVSRGTTQSKHMNNRILGLFMLLLFFASCGIQRTKYTIEDYALVPNAKRILGNEGLTAFVFENNKRILPFQQFLVIRFNLQTFNQREIPFAINDERFTLHIYDADETAKYINTFDFVVKDQIPDSSKIGLQSDFIVLSVINDKNEDCLNDNSLYQNIVIKYLKNLKEDYFSNDR